MKKITTDYQIFLQKACSSFPEIPSESQFQEWLSEVLNYHHIKTARITIRLVDAAESAKLNRLYRHKFGPTNVLSFHYSEMLQQEQSVSGDLVICPEVVIKEANEQNKSVLFHWAHLCIHGGLHLLGYDHIKEDEAIIMEGLEIQFLQEWGISNPYEE